ncbi:uncharacterized protein TNCV_156421 [Trichonephila clavipes]|nr:uncharacterized protein TNCV_156421 [Trichonephila clavipes]
MSQRRRLPNSLRWRAVGWMEMGLSQTDAARLLNVFSDFGINTNPKILCPEDLFQADHELQHLQKKLFGTKEKNHYCAAARCRPLSSIRKKESPLLRCEIVFTMQVCMQEEVVCVPPQRTTAKEPLMLGKRTCFLDAATMGFCAVHRRVQIYNGE